MTFGHLALASIAHDTLFKKIGLLFLTLAAFGPDIADKPLRLLFDSNGRGLGHTLLFFLLVAAVGWLLVRKRTISAPLFLAAVLLWLSHLAADFIDQTILFWPFLGPFPDEPSISFWEKIDYWLHFYQRWNWESIQVYLEFGCIFTALILRKTRRSGWKPSLLFRRASKKI